jgi:hypothetical protein
MLCKTSTNENLKKPCTQCTCMWGLVFWIRSDCHWPDRDFPWLSSLSRWIPEKYFIIDPDRMFQNPHQQIIHHLLLSHLTLGYTTLIDLNINKSRFSTFLMRDLTDRISRSSSCSHSGNEGIFAKIYALHIDGWKDHATYLTDCSNIVRTRL